MDAYQQDKTLAQIEIMRHMLLKHLKILRQNSGQVNLYYVGEFETDVRMAFKLLRETVEA